MADLELIQVAFSIRDLEGTPAWYRDTFGYLDAGVHTEFRGADAAAVQGLPASESTIHWLVDARDGFQLELFAFDEPAPRGDAHERGADAVGYSLIGVAVDDFDAVLAKVAPLGPVVGAAGSRRVAVRDPEGVIVEVMEDDPRPSGAPPRKRPEVPVTTRFVRLVVPDLARARAFYTEKMGLAEAPAIHGPEHEALWGLEGIAVTTQAMWAGDFVLELAEYVSPRPRADGYRLSDQGLVNVALGCLGPEPYDAAFARLEGTGFTAYKELAADGFKCRYVEDDQGNSVEMLYMSAKPRKSFGFSPVG